MLFVDKLKIKTRGSVCQINTTLSTIKLFILIMILSFFARRRGRRSKLFMSSIINVGSRLCK